MEAFALDTIDPQSPVAVGAFVLAVVQLGKDLGLQGHWLKLLSVAVGGVAALLSISYPDLWALLFTVNIGATVTGGVSFVNGLLQKMKARPTE